MKKMLHIGGMDMKKMLNIGGMYVCDKRCTNCIFYVANTWKTDEIGKKDGYYVANMCKLDKYPRDRNDYCKSFKKHNG